MSIKARRKNLRMYNLDSDEIQGNYGLMIRAAQQEALAPSSPTIGADQTAICLLQFRIKASNPNVPPLQPARRDGEPAGEKARKAEEAGKYRIACHAMIVDNDVASIGQSGLEHSSHCLPSPFAKSRITKNDYILLARRYPIYVGKYIDPATGQEVGDGPAAIHLEPGMSIRVRDNDVQGGMYGTITEILDTERVITQLPDGTIRALFNGGEGGLGGPGGPAVYDEGFDADAKVYEGSEYTWRDVTVTGTGLNNTPDPAAQAELEKLVKQVFEPLDRKGIGFTINSAYRSPEVNAAVGGVQDSFHMKGSGADLQFAGADKSNRSRQVQLFEKDIPAAIGNWHRMIIYEDTNHIHISIGAAKYKQVKLADGGYADWDSYGGPLSIYKSELEE